jgi:general secretion pathway protein A
MYTNFFGLQKDPFKMSPDPAFLYLTAEYREAAAGLTYAILSRKGLVVLTGDAGTGKTTLLAKVLQSVPPNQVQCSVLLHPTLTSDEFMEMALLDFGLGEVPESKAKRLDLLRTFLLKRNSEGKITVLLVDEAHKLSTEVLEEIRLLGNFEYADAKLLQIVLLGQSELNATLNRDDLRQLKQRIALRLHTLPLSPRQVDQYIQHRWIKAGGQAMPFCREALDQVAFSSQGIPRLINSICDNALMVAFANERALVSAGDALEACTDLDLLTGRVRVPDAARAGTGEQTPATAGAAPLDSAPIRTLETYRIAAEKPSFLARWAGRLGLAG